MTDLLAKLADRITAYLSGGGLFNPDLANHEAVRDLLIECRDAFKAQPSGDEWKLPESNYWGYNKAEGTKHSVLYGEEHLHAAFSAGLAARIPAGWIPVSERMPEPQVRVLALDHARNYAEVDMWFGPDFLWGYSHWMPIPPITATEAPATAKGGE